MGASTCCYFSYLCNHLRYLLYSPFCATTPIASYTTSSSQILSIPTSASPTSPRLSPHSHHHQLHTFHCQPRWIHHDRSIDIYGEERAVQRLNIILSLKEAYLKAMGQPTGFNFSRINCDVAKEVVNEASKCIYKWCIVILSLI